MEQACLSWDCAADSQPFTDMEVMPMHKNSNRFVKPFMAFLFWVCVCFNVNINVDINIFTEICCTPTS